MNNIEELRRLQSGPQPGEEPQGLLAEVAVECDTDASRILDATRQVWAIAIKQSNPGETSLDEWKKLFPKWFVEKFGSEISMEEATRRRALPMQERRRLAETWSLGAWMHWLKPSERQWAWWDAEIVSPQLLQVKVVVDGFPFPAGSLQWLLKCCGARSAEILE